MDFGFRVVCDTSGCRLRLGTSWIKRGDMLCSSSLLGVQWACLVSDRGYLYTSPIAKGRKVQHGILSGARFVWLEARNAISDEMVALANLLCSLITGVEPWPRACSANNTTLGNLLKRWYLNQNCI